MKKFLLFCFATVCLLACEKTKEEIPVSSVSINQPTAEMIEGETVQLKATVLPADATVKTVEWSSSKQSVATITDKGLVTAIAEGTSTITASAGGKSSSCVVTVSKRVIEVTSVTLNKEDLELVEGEEETLVANVLPDNATDKTIEWSSSAPDIAKVEGGKVSALKEGEAIITAKAGTKSASCKVVVTKKFIAVESVELNKNNLELVEGDSDILVATVKPDDATDKTVTWISSDDEVVSVDDSGKVKAIQEGKATIAARAGEKTATCEVAVSKKVIPVESITLDRTSISMVEDESTVLTATVKPDNATDKTVTWSSSDTDVATVKDGRVTSIKEGRATITAKAGDKEATCEIIVDKRIIEVTSITLNYPDLSLVKGDEQVLVATVEPDNATDKTITWSSSDAQVASVDKEGKVKALKSGTATIKAKAGEKAATCEVTVTTPVESISLDRTSITLEEGQSIKLAALITPEDADNQDVSGNSSNAKVAKVDQAGLVTAVKEGETTITANAGNQSATCMVTVQKTVIPVTSITLNKTNVTIEKGKSEKLTATVKPDNATDKTVNWSSSDVSIASVDSNGMVTAQNGGNAIITAKAGDLTATCSVTVTVPVESVSLDQTSVSMYEGQSVTLTATVYPIDATDQVLTWSSSNTSVATVSDGSVSAVKKGNATIMVKVGGKSASCFVEVLHDTSNDAIVFADSKIKEKLVAAFDTNGDGELSYAEVATVTSLDGVFGTEVSFVSFDEFQFFTGVISITDSQFEGWEIKSIILPENVKYIGDRAFKQCESLESIILSNSLERFGSRAFEDCRRLKTIIIPDKVTGISMDAFNGCYDLQSITFPDGIKVFGMNAFKDCKSLTNIALPKDLETIGGYAFANCIGIKTLSLPEKVTEIKENVFEDCRNLSSLSLPKGLSKIGEGAFVRCESLTSIDIPVNITVIERITFSGCLNLASVSLPDGISKIKQFAFSGCESLTSISLPKKLSVIEQSAFSLCHKLSSISLPENITDIGDKAFIFCDSLEKITVLAKSVPFGGNKMFQYTNNCPIYVPSASVSAYKTAEYWSDYADRIQAIP